MRKFNRRFVETHILAALLCMLVCLVSCRKEASFWQDKMDRRIDNVRMIEETKYRNRANELINYYETLNEEDAEDPDAQDLARILYEFRGYNLSNRSKMAVIDVIMNRVKCEYGGFGDSIHEVCSKPGQFAYSEHGQYLYDDYHLAYDYLYNYHGGTQIPDGYYWLIVEPHLVTARDAYTKTRTTGYYCVQ